MADWYMSDQELLSFMEQMIAQGITSFDHADIYGNYSCEAILGKVMKLEKGFRNQIEIVTKCGIKLISDKFPERKVKIYDYSYEHITSSVEKSLSNFGTDRIDLLLLHRPAPFFEPEEVAKAFSDLKKSGKVLYFGVSNFTPIQYQMLRAYCDVKLVTNQVEISPYCLEHFDNGNIDFFLKERLRPMAYSPLAWGKLLNPVDEKGERILKAILQVADELNVTSADKVIYTWLLRHPAGFLPVLGTGKIERIKDCIEALDIPMNLEQWYMIYNASKGKQLP
jgi:predicted oxidoreductase